MVLIQLQTNEETYNYLNSKKSRCGQTMMMSTFQHLLFRNSGKCINAVQNLRWWTEKVRTTSSSYSSYHALLHWKFIGLKNAMPTNHLDSDSRVDPLGCSHPKTVQAILNISSPNTRSDKVRRPFGYCIRENLNERGVRFCSYTISGDNVTSWEQHKFLNHVCCVSEPQIPYLLRSIFLELVRNAHSFLYVTTPRHEL
jgi:hypothetical protein